MASGRAEGLGKVREAVPVRIGVIGCGHWGPNHVRNFAAHPDSDVVAIADVEAKRLAALQAVYPRLAVYQDYHALLSREDIDAVVVATPASTHHAVVTAALAAGKHVLCEKPLCPSVADGITLVQMAEERRLLLMVGHVFLFNPAVVKLKELADRDRPQQILPSPQKLTK